MNTSFVQVNDKVADINKEIDYYKLKIKELREKLANYCKENKPKLPSNYIHITGVDYGKKANPYDFLFYVKDFLYDYDDGSVFALQGSFFGLNCRRYDPLLTIYYDEYQNAKFEYISKEEYDKLFDEGLKMIKETNFEMPKFYDEDEQSVSFDA